MSTKDDVKEKKSTQALTDTPSRYKVLLLNDDYTSMDFVIEILVHIFGHTMEKAVTTMLNIHHYGSEVCGVYSYEIAETKVAQVLSEAQKQDFPLRAIMEEE